MLAACGVFALTAFGMPQPPLPQYWQSLRRY
jgi:hypothetical protein